MSNHRASEFPSSLESIAIVVVLAIASSWPASTVAAEDRPNVIFMLTDDLGYSDIGCCGARKVKTPHIDRRAAEGVRFTDFHTAASICSPSWAAFLTGAYVLRIEVVGKNPESLGTFFGLDCVTLKNSD